MSTQETRQIELRIGRQGMEALLNVTMFHVTRHTNQAKHVSATTTTDTAHQRSNTLSAFVSQLQLAVRQSSTETYTVQVGNPELVKDELAKLYLEFGPEKRAKAKNRIEDASVEEVATLLAGWGHRAG